MKAFLTILLILISLGLCGVCWVQWMREARLNAVIAERTQQLVQENKLRLDLQDKADRYENEIARLTTLRAETEAALLLATEDVQQRTADQTGRGYSIAVLMNELIADRTSLEAYKKLAGQGSDAVKDRNEEVKSQNAAIEKQNAQMKQLAEERDNAINQLNARTKEYNELVEKYNKLAKER